MIIDAWANIALPGTLEVAPDVERLFRQARRSEVLQTGIDAEAMIAQMDAAGVDRALVTAWHREGVWEYSNERVRELVARYPNRIVGIAAVDIRQPDKAADELTRAVEQWGFKGLRLVPWLWNRPPDDRLYYPLYVRCQELDVPVCLQVGHTGPLAPSEPGRPIPYLDRVALDFPELRLVGGHLGYPWTEEMIALAWKHEHVYIDTSAHLPRYYPPQLLHFATTYGREKVLFATNFPMLAWDQCVRQAQELELPDEAAAEFLGGNTARVYKLD